MIEMIEKEENSFCEEPKIYYYSTSANFGVRSFFSDRKKNQNNFPALSQNKRN